VATAPSASLRERAPTVRRRDAVLWWAVFAVLGSLCVAYALLPLSLNTLRNVVIYPGIGLAAVSCIVLGVLHYRPAAPQAWLAIAAGIFMWFVGDLLWGVYELVGLEPYPSVADLFYLAGYPLIALGLGYALRLRSSGMGVETGTVIDGVLFTVLAALLAWVYVIDPILDDPSLSVGQQLVSIAYPIGDVLLASVAAYFVMGTSWRVPALGLLVAGLGFTLLGDVLYATNVVSGAHGDRVWGTALLVGLVCFALAGLSPSMRALTEERREADTARDNVRQLFLGIACLIPPSVLVVQSVRDKPLYLVVTSIAMAAVSGLVVLRFAWVTNRVRRAAAREAVLRRYAAELLRVSDEDELRAAATATGSELVGNGTVELVTPGLEPEGTPHGFSVPVEVRGERFAEIVADAEPLALRRAHDSLAMVASQLALAIERLRLLQSERETAEALAEQNTRLLELDRMKDQFVSSVSHELRTPLTSMVGYLELLVEGEAGTMNDEQQHFVEIVNRNCLRLNRLVDDILFIARVDAGRLSLERETVDLGEIAATAAESARAAALAKNIELRLETEDDLPSLEADPLRLTQMLDNLISNALKFTPEAGTVTVTLSSDGDENVHLEVADTGVGIPADEMEKLFDRFFRASTSAVAAGTGLGLSIVKSIVDVHGGTVSVKSTEGVGTTFVVDLPVRVEQETPTAAAGVAKGVPT
jgi:signal transduction histidine kinase